MKKIYEFEKYDDASHGWLKVEKSLLAELNISHLITDFSYMKENYAYLEEDCDASRFLEALEIDYPEAQVRFKYIDCEHDRTHNPRGFEDYSFTPANERELRPA